MPASDYCHTMLDKKNGELGDETYQNLHNTLKVSGESARSIRHISKVAEHVRFGLLRWRP